jgi:L-fuculose-phosphate aldolase
MAEKICYTYNIMNIDKLKRELARYARKMAQDGLTVGASGNISARHGRKFYIKVSGRPFADMKSADFIGLDINNPKVKGPAKKPSCEYRLHAECYKKRPNIKAVFHTHPFFTAMAFSGGLSDKPVTMEFAAYISCNIKAIEFCPPGSRKLAMEVGEACKSHDCVIMKKHGIITLGETTQDAYLKNLIIEREARARIIVKLLRIKGACFSRKEIAMLVDAV